MKNNVSILAKDAPFPVWYGEPFEISNEILDGSVLFRLKAPLEEYKRALSGGVDCCVLPTLDDRPVKEDLVHILFGDDYEIGRFLDKEIPFALCQLSRDISEILYIGLDSVFYVQAKVRPTSFFHTSDRGLAIYNWLKRRAKKKMAKGYGLKDVVSARLYESSFVCNHLIPVGIRNPRELIVPSTSFVHENFLNSMFEIYGNKIIKQIKKGEFWALVNEMVFIRSLEKSDTPVWITPSDDLTVMLINTQPSMINESDVRLVAPAVFVEFQKGVFGIKRNDGLEVSIDGAFLYEALDEERNRILIVGLMYILNGGLCSMPMYLYVSDLVKVVAGAENSNDNETDLVYKIYGKEVENRVFSKKTSYFLLNILLYISNQSSLIKRSVVRREIKVKTKDKKKKKKKKEKIGISLYEELVIGTEVLLSNEDKEIMKRSASEGWKISYSFLVRGHWRNQACGPGMSLRKRKWIEPYVKGKDLASRIVGHSYVDKKTSEQAQSAGR